MYKLICLACSNGCSLQVARLDKETMVVAGNKCPKGIAFAYEQLKDKERGRFISAWSDDRYSADYIKDLLKCWHKDIVNVLPTTFVQGSPERSLFRTVVEDRTGNKFVLEEFAATDLARKKRIAENLIEFDKSGLPVNPYIQNDSGCSIIEYDGKCWLLSNFVEGIALDRLSYWQDAWRGKAVAKFLIKLYRESKNKDLGDEQFSLVEYIESLLINISNKHPGLVEHLSPYVNFLREELFPKYDSVPLGFCHGDAHPLNMIWGNDKINVVIDWEFSGLKPVLFDCALIIGCVGSEAADARHSSFVTAFKETIEKEKIFSNEIYALLPLFTFASRFAWLSEWLRHSDEEMINFELYYMNLLMDECKN